jgi:predicted RND superfamily exporter protein
MADAMLPETVQAETTGFNYLLGAFLEELLPGQRRGLAFAIGTITIMMMLMFRSFKQGAWAMLPNIFPLLILGCVAGLWWDRVDTDLIIIIMIAVGIGVDDTIHFLSRLRFESRRTADPNLALQRTFHFSGRAMATTTIILSAGFLPLGLSNYFTIQIFGTLLPLTLLSALSADILLVPALVKVGAIRFPSAPSETANLNIFRPVTEETPL